MIFTPEHCRKILNGEKTQTRRLVKRQRTGYGERGHGIEEVIMRHWTKYEDELEGDLYEEGFKGDGVYLYEWEFPQDTWQGPAEFDAWIVRAKWLIGRTYAIQPGRGKKSVGRFKLLAIRKERLQDISQVGAYHEGIPLTVDSGGVTPWGDWIEIPNQNWREDFAALWNSINKSPGTRWEDNPRVWCLEFELVEEG